MSKYFSNNLAGEQQLADSIYRESVRNRGREVRYIKRDRLNDDAILGESDRNRFKDHMPIPMFMREANEFSGMGDMFVAFGGTSLTDNSVWECSRTEFQDSSIRSGFPIQIPKEGDLIYDGMSNTLWEIQKVKGDDNFYRHGREVMWVLNCDLFEYSHEDMDTGISDIDDIEDVTDVVGQLIKDISDDNDADEIIADVVEEELIDDDVFDPTKDIL